MLELFRVVETHTFLPPCLFHYSCLIFDKDLFASLDCKTRVWRNMHGLGHNLYALCTYAVDYETVVTVINYWQ